MNVFESSEQNKRHKSHFSPKWALEWKKTILLVGKLHIHIETNAMKWMNDIALSY